MKIYIIAYYNYENGFGNHYYDRPIKKDMVPINVSIPDQIRTNAKKLIGHDLEGNPLYKGGDEGYYHEKILRKVIFYGWIVDNIESFRDLVKEYNLQCSTTYFIVGDSDDLIFIGSGNF